MVSRAYDESPQNDAGKYKTDRSDHRLVDARVPLSSRNPDIDELGKNKARLILLNKSDLAEERINDEWIDYFKDRGYSAVKVNSKKGGGMNQIRSAIQEACKEKQSATVKEEF